MKERSDPVVDSRSAFAVAGGKPDPAEGIDPVSLRVIWDRLIGITYEVGRTLERTAFSIVVREGKDYGVVITDADGNCVAQPTDCTPVFLGTLPYTIRNFLRVHPRESLRPGDSLITNDPWAGTGHLADVSVATPICDASGRLFAFAACTAHMPDIGGRIDRAGTREIYEEGLLIPMLKLEKAGILNDDLLEFVRHNVRVPDGVVGDIMAMLTANRTASDSLGELVGGEGIDFAALARAIIGRTEDAMRDAIRAIPKGSYRASSWGDGLTGPFEIRAEVRVGDGEVFVDFEGTSEQVEAPLNAVFAYTLAFTGYALKSIIHPRVPNNEGTFLPLTVTAPIGSLLNAQHPIAVHLRHLAGHFIVPTIFRALADVVPERVIADSGSTPSRLETWSGTGPEGRRFVQYVSHSGGMGAGPQGDGDVACFPSNQATTPVEMVETDAPLLIREKRLLIDSGGPGRFRGGLGQRVTTRNISSGPVYHEVTPCRLTFPARGILGGRDAGVYHLFMNGQPHPRPQGTTMLRPDDEVTVEYPGGGGFGRVEDRSPDLVAADVLDGAVSADSARDTYRLKP